MMSVTDLENKKKEGNLMASAEEMRESVEMGAEVMKRSRKSVMQVTWSLVAGGAETYALTVASHLDAARYQSSFCAMDQGGALEEEVQRLGIPYAIMNRRPGIEWGLMWRMYRLFRREGVDVIHTHHFNQLFYSLLGAKLLGIRIIHTEHSVEAYKKRRLRMALRLLSIFCHKVTVIGSDGETTLRQKVGIPARKLKVIRAAVDLNKFSMAREEARRELGLEREDRVATIVARLFPEKNHRMLLNAFNIVIKHIPQCKLLIVGDGVEEGAIGEEIRRLGLGERVRMMGVRRDVARILAASDAFVLTSDREGLPIAVLEAMAAGKAVIATAVGDLPLVVQEGVTGHLVGRGDAEGMAEAMKRVLGDLDYAEKLGANGRRAVEREYSMGGLIRQHESLYAGEERKKGSGVRGQGSEEEGKRGITA